MGDENGVAAWRGGGVWRLACIAAAAWRDVGSVIVAASASGGARRRRGGAFSSAAAARRRQLLYQA
jgi:hypothetical protein